MFHSNKHRRKNLRITTELSLISLILAIGLAGIETVWVLYLSHFGLNDSIIGFISASLVIVSLFAAFFSTPILEKLNEYKILIISLIVTIILLLIIASYSNLYVFLILAVLLTISSVFRLNSFDILFRDESKTKDLNENEGLMYAIANIGWLVGPLVAGFILLEFGINKVFISSSIFITIGLFILFKLKINLPVKKRNNIDTNFIKNIKDYIKNKKLILAYTVAAGIEIWWAMIYIYVPLFIIKNGLDESIVGIFLASVVIPLVLFEYQIGKLSEKYGFKIYLISGFFLLGGFSIIAFLSNNIYLTLIVLAIASIPMAFLEPIQDSYFFKQIRKVDEEKYFPIYGTATHIGSFIGKFSIAGILLLFSDNYAYLIIGMFMFLIGIFCLKIKE